MNVQLHHVLSDITGLSGLAILDAILAEERDPRALSRLRDGRVKESEETMVQALTGDYTRGDIELLAAMDTLHEALGGPATRKLLQRAYSDCGDTNYQRLAQLSVAQLYRLRQSQRYREQRVRYQPTRPTAVSIGERRKLEVLRQSPGVAGYLKPEVTIEGLEQRARAKSEMAAAEEMQTAKPKLFATFHSKQIA